MSILILKDFRDKRNISREEQAEILGITIETLNTWEYRKKDIPARKLEYVKNTLNTYVPTTQVTTLNPSKAFERKFDLQEVPLYDGTVTASVVNLFKTPSDNEIIDTVKIPNMPKCDGAITVTGDSMYPLIKSGDIVFYKVINDLPASIFYGNMYIVSVDLEGDELVMLKYVQKGKDEQHLLLVSENRHHADKQVHVKNINAIALVKGNVRFNFTT